MQRFVQMVSPVSIFGSSRAGIGWLSHMPPDIMPVAGPACSTAVALSPCSLD